MTDPKYFTKLFLNPLEAVVDYMDAPYWSDNITNTQILAGGTESFSLDLNVDSVTALYDDTGTEIDSANYTVNITGENTIEVTNDSGSSFTVSEINYVYATDFSAPSFGDINWSRLEPPLLMIIPDIFSVEGGDTLINRVQFNFIYERSYQYSDFEGSADQVFTILGLIFAEVLGKDDTIGDVNIGEVETYQGEVNDNYLESISVEIIYTTFIDWDEFFSSSN